MHLAVLMLLLTQILPHFPRSSQPGEVLGKAYEGNQERKLTFSVMSRINPQPDLARSARDSEPKPAELISGVPFASAKPDLFILPSRQRSAFARALSVSGDGGFSQSEALAETKKIFNHQRAADFLASLTDSLQRNFSQRDKVNCSLQEIFSCKPRDVQVQAFLASHVALLTEYRIQTVDLTRDTDGIWALRSFSLSEELP